MIYTATKRKIYRGYECNEERFEEGSLYYLTNGSGLDANQREKILREGGFSSRFMRVGSNQAIGASLFGSGTFGTILATGPEFEVWQNGLWLGASGVLATIAGTLGYYGYRNAQRALKEARAKKAILPSETKLFPIVGRPWDALKEALQQIEADDIAKTNAIQASKLVKQLPAKSRQAPKRFKEAKAKVGQGLQKVKHELELLRMPEDEYRRYMETNGHGNVTELEPSGTTHYPDSELVLWQVFVTALKEHTPLGRQLDIIMSNYLVRTEEVVTQIGRDDQDPKWVKQLEDTLRRSAYAQMMEMYPLLTAKRDSECFEPGQKCTEHEYKVLRTRGEAAAAAEAAICAAEPLTYSYQPQLP